MKAVIHNSYKSFDLYIRSIPEIFSTSGKTLYEARNMVKLISLGGHDFVVKRYKRPNLMQRIAYTFFCKGKAERAFTFADRFLKLGVDTPAPVAYIEIKRCGLLLDSYFVSEPTSSQPLYPELVEKTDYDHSLSLSVARLIASLHEKGALHGDPNLNNILFSRSRDGSPIFTVIDTNRSRFSKKLSKNECLNNIMRLTHRRDLLAEMTREYSSIRGWDPEETVNEVMKRISRFEHRRAIRHKFKNLFR